MRYCGVISPVIRYAVAVNDVRNVEGKVGNIITIKLFIQ